jgi:RNA polymerase sigma factor (sigma-70 family)
MNWLTTHVRRLQRLLRRRGVTREDTEDLIQEVFLRVLVYCEEGNEVREPEAFMVRAALNLSANLHEREHRKLYVAKPVDELDIVDTSCIPDEVVAADQCLHSLQRALDALEPRTREVYYMHRVQGLKYTQIASHFKISVSAVEKHVARATGALTREMLGT